MSAKRQNSTVSDKSSLNSTMDPKSASKRAEAEEQVRTLATRLKILTDASQAFAEAGQDHQAVLDQVVRQVTETLADMCQIRLLSDDGHLLKLAAIDSRDPEFSQALRNIALSISERADDPGMAQYVFRTGKPALVPVITVEQTLTSLPPEYKEIDRRFAPHSYIVVSLRVQGRSIGVLVLTRYRTEQPAFTDDDVTLAQDLADRAALVINSVQLSKLVQDELADRNQAEESLRESESKYRLISENAIDWVYWVAPDRTFRFCSPSCERLTGYSATEFLTTPGLLEKIVHPDDIQILHNHSKIVDYEDCKSFEFRIITKNGSVRWINHSCNKILSQGSEYLGRRGTNRDITERKLAEEALHKMTERLELATHSAQIGTWDWDILDNNLVWDSQMFKLYGMDRDQFPAVYKAWLNGVHPEDRVLTNEISQKAIKGDVEYDTEFRVVWPDGSIHWLKANGQVFRDESGQAIRMVGVNYDITERKRTDNILRESEERFTTLFEKSAFVAVLSKLPNGVILNVNGAFEETFEFTKEEAVGKTTLELGINPDAAGRERVLVQLQKHGSVRNLDIELHIKSGEIHMFLLSVDLIDIGDEKYILNTLQDITDRKQAEKALHQKMDELLQFQRVTIGRELKMIELKKEINTLLKQAGAPEKYRIADVQ